jgi:hypothetical protein
MQICCTSSALALLSVLAHLLELLEHLLHASMVLGEHVDRVRRARVAAALGMGGLLRMYATRVNACDIPDRLHPRLASYIGLTTMR